jgi:integrase
MTSILPKSVKPSGCKVGIVNINGAIALRFTFNRQRQTVYLGLSYEKNNLDFAIAKAWEIHNDIIFNRYDGNKDKYKIGFGDNNAQKENPNNLIEVDFHKQEPTLKQVWDFYKKIKSKTKDETWNRIDKNIVGFENLPISNVANFVEFLLNKYAKSTVKRMLEDLTASINLSIDYGKFDGKNLLPKIIETLDVTIQKTIKAFTDSEVLAILNAFKNDTYNPKSSRYKHSYYYPLIAFRFLTGCRPSEAMALTWNDIIEKNGKIWIKFNKRYTNKELKGGTKNGVTCRLFPVNNELKELLDSIDKRPETNLIFPSYENTYIDRSSFSSRIWKPVVESLVKDGLVREYLPFYDIRHTFATKLCRSGKVDLKTISSIIGNSVDTLIENYSYRTAKNATYQFVYEL